jgi:hypothetical protein
MVAIIVSSQKYLQKYLLSKRSERHVRHQTHHGQRWPRSLKSQLAKVGTAAMLATKPAVSFEINLRFIRAWKGLSRPSPEPFSQSRNDLSSLYL